MNNTLRLVSIGDPADPVIFIDCGIHARQVLLLCFHL